MILIADSGSTKTDWCAVEQGQIIQTLCGKGMNPFFQTADEITAEIVNLLKQLGEGKSVSAIHFYGAGCTAEKSPIVKAAIEIALARCPGLTGEGGNEPHHLVKPTPCTIEVSTDMLGAARALCGRRRGIACILGTGSNSCLYDGHHMVHNVSPLGFILGDEGSGAHLGKLLVGDLLKGQLPASLKAEFLARYELTPADVIERVYRRPFPNRFLASLSPFIAEHLSHRDVRQLVVNAFTAFIQRNVMQYDEWRHTPVHFIGSIAHHYRDVLEEAAVQTGISLGAIEQSPMPGLVRFHQ